MKKVLVLAIVLLVAVIGVGAQDDKDCTADERLQAVATFDDVMSIFVSSLTYVSEQGDMGIAISKVLMTTQTYTWYALQRDQLLACDDLIPIVLETDRALGLLTVALHLDQGVQSDNYFELLRESASNLVSLSTEAGLLGE